MDNVPTNEQDPAAPLAPERQHPEPLFNAPAIVLVLCGTLLACHAALAFGLLQQDQIVDAYALTSQSLAGHRWITLISYAFLHSGWMHLLVNTGFLLAFGTAPARLFGDDLRGSAVFTAFFLVCGALAGLGYALVQTSHAWGIIGASGAVAGMAGVTARMLNTNGRLGPPWGRPFFGMTAMWVLINVAIGLIGFDGQLVAWQAHLIGYAAGVGLVDIFWRLAGKREPITQ